MKLRFYTPLFYGLFVLFLFSSAPPFARAADFTDIKPIHKYSEAIHHLSTIGMIKGYSDGSFRPERTISREEAVKLITLANHPALDLSTTEPAPFPDIEPDRWSAPYINWGYQAGIINGYPDGYFQPKKTINFAEGLKIILESFELDLQQPPYRDRPLIHMDADDWYAAYFNYAYEKNLINRQKYYHPKKNMSRGEFCEILYRLKIVQNLKLRTFPLQAEKTSDEYTITIPTLNIIDLNVSFADLYNTSQALSVLKDGLGHYLSPPDKGERMIVFGHSSGYQWDNSNYKQILRHIDQLKEGDRIYINYKEKGYAYEINEREILPANQLNKIITSEDHNQSLALYTCWPPDQISHRYVIYATPLNS